MQLTHEQYDDLESAISGRARIAVWRRGSEFVVIPSRLRVLHGREAVEALHPATGDHMTLYLDELESLEVVR